MSSLQNPIFYRFFFTCFQFNSDLYGLLFGQSIDKSRKKQQNTNALLKWNVSELLKNVHPLSYS